jgi:hypothetical protein
VDAIVARAMARWPDVPDVYGWLSLDRRGQWRLQGGTIGNLGLRQFISRNYMALSDGRYVFQNGPQRVFVALECTPWVASLDGNGELRTHTDAIMTGLQRAWLDDDGALLLEFSEGLALVDDRDLEALTATLVDASGAVVNDTAQAEAIEALLDAQSPGLSLRWNGEDLPLQRLVRADAARKFGFVVEPLAPV